jgi:hypothetical protein
MFLKQFKFGKAESKDTLQCQSCVKNISENILFSRIMLITGIICYDERIFEITLREFATPNEPPSQKSF